MEAAIDSPYDILGEQDVAETEKTSLLQGTLDMLVLKSLLRGTRHGYDIARWIETTSDDILSVEEGSLYPALHRLERKGWIVAEWGLSESNRRAKYYTLTRVGRAQLTREVETWAAVVRGISLILNAPNAEVQP